MQRPNAFRTLLSFLNLPQSLVKKIFLKELLLLRYNSHKIKFTIFDLKTGSLCLFGLQRSTHGYLQLLGFVPCKERLFRTQRTYHDTDACDLYRISKRDCPHPKSQTQKSQGTNSSAKLDQAPTPGQNMLQGRFPK